MMTDADKELPVSVEQVRINTAIDDVKATLTGRSPRYKRPPAEYVDIDLLIGQVVLKAERARQVITVEDQIEELRDTAGYAILTMGRLLSSKYVDTVSLDDDIALHNKKLQNHIGKTDEEFSMYSDGYHTGYTKALDISYVEGYNKALADHDLMLECDIGLILHGRQERKSP